MDEEPEMLREGPERVDVVVMAAGARPNVDLARAALNHALKRTGLEPDWIEHEHTSGVPKRFSRFGSPTILVNSKDVADEPGAAARSGL